ncbi:peptide/nickel transport system ATP-binding protein/oligopeptide transport system ATP-binding protein [Sinosporangium album]|uniref:Peptide/nickel transport system ATP-binding protein/oligopeptide transport system ATP-binding protein n=1 Tax=Sinosporangium album TaxID=504805 RepID=A0A1G8B128_9ACTN|nr:oligopeptide/dipeptide ABC transporter ATP-binding protein [Sinosporangium album]SDH26969.1 peptide/nickel transport system ATP-binding protein/oligopeptide transport system ATP-binding protein [Sinosporangium album]
MNTVNGLAPASAVPALQVTGLTKHFRTAAGTVRAVDDVSFSIGKGEIVGLVGESGSGKSTVGRCVVMLSPPTAGSVVMDGVEISGLQRGAIRRRRTGFTMIFQDPATSLNPRMQVRDIVAEPLVIHRIGQPGERERRATELLDLVGLPQMAATRFPHELSGGQRQRVSIARALIASPSLVVADEPTSALDVSIQASILNLIKDLQRDLGFACLFISHDLAAVEYVADRVMVMYLGRVVETIGSAELNERAAHPYTQALVSAAPVPDPDEQRSRERITLSGDIPSPLAPPPGCHFHLRCPVAMDVCRDRSPELVAGSGTGHTVACHRVS